MNALKKYSSPEKAKASTRFFKTAEGQYGYGDIFIGLTAPEQRLVARTYRDLPLPEIKRLLDSKIHEHRLTALLILVDMYESADQKSRAAIVKLYLSETKHINNWDLVDSSARYILGEYLGDKDRKILYKLVTSHNIWERRIAMIATHAFIRNDDFADTLKLSQLLLNDTHDLMHKAVGWTLREVGKRSPSVLRDFLNKEATHMPRTALRYAIERFDPKERASYLAVKATKPTK